MVDVSFDAVDWKMKEAKFFLDHIEIQLDERGPIGIEYFFSAFVSAARSVTFCLQCAMSRVRGFSDWYESWQERLRSDPVARLFHNRRNMALKRGRRSIGRYSFTTQDGGALRGACYFYDSLMEDWSEEERLDTITLAKGYLGTLSALIEDCRTRFGHVVQPEDVFSSEFLQVYELTVDDLAHRMGMPRNLVDGMSQQDLLATLRRCSPPWRVQKLLDELGTQEVAATE